MNTDKKTDDIKRVSISTKNPFQKIESWLPIFPGFYGTIFEYPDNDIEYNLFDDPDNIAKELKDFIVEDVYDNIDYTQYQNDVVVIACDYIQELLLEHFPLICKKVEFQSIKSPKEYNFTNDSVDVVFDVNFNLLLKTCMKHKDFTEYLKGRYTSYDGFSSSYPNNIKEWAEEAFDDQSHTVGSMLEFLLLADVLENQDYTIDMYYCCSENIYAGEYIQYDKIIEAINDKFTYNKPMTEWDMEVLESYEPIVGGTLSDQLLTGIGLYETDPADIPITDFIDENGLYIT